MEHNLPRTCFKYNRACCIKKSPRAVRYLAVPYSTAAQRRVNVRGIWKSAPLGSPCHDAHRDGTIPSDARDDVPHATRARHAPCACSSTTNARAHGRAEPSSLSRYGPYAANAVVGRHDDNATVGRARRCSACDARASCTVRVRDDDERAEPSTPRRYGPCAPTRRRRVPTNNPQARKVP